MPTQLLFTQFLNAHFAAPVTALLRAVHVQPKFPEAPISNAFAMELLVFGVLMLLGAIAGGKKNPPPS